MGIRPASSHPTRYCIVIHMPLGYFTRLLPRVPFLEYFLLSYCPKLLFAVYLASDPTRDLLLRYLPIFTFHFLVPPFKPTVCPTCQSAAASYSLSVCRYIVLPSIIRFQTRHTVSETSNFHRPIFFRPAKSHAYGSS